MTNGKLGMEVVRILEAANESLKLQGASVSLEEPLQAQNGQVHTNGSSNGNGKGKAHGEAITPETERSRVAA